MKRILVVCYSRTGHTRSLAEAIAERCEADVEWIQDRDPRLGLKGYLRSAAQALWHRTPWIQPPRRSPSDYSLVIIGTPVWAGCLASPVRSYVEHYGDRCRRVAFFATCGGKDADKAFADLQRLLGKRPLATVVVQDRRVNSSETARALEPFMRRCSGDRLDSVSGARLQA